MKEIVVGIVEDELIIADNIADSLHSLGYKSAGPALNFTDGLEMLENEQPDIVLLDIILSGKKDGVDLAWKIKEEYDLPFIFLTSHADKATVDRAKQAEPHAYLVKPFNKDELYSAIEVAMHNFVHNKRVENESEVQPNSNYLLKDCLFIKDKDTFFKIRFDEITYLKNDHVYIEVHTAGRSYLTRSNMSEYLEKMPGNFLRIHRSYAINIDHLTQIEGDEVIIGDTRIPIAKSYKNELLSKLQIG